jgi:hypothetical protein
VAEELRNADEAGNLSSPLDVRTSLALLTADSVWETRGTAYPISTSKADEFEAMADVLTEALEPIPTDFPEFVHDLESHRGLPDGPPWIDKSPRTTLPNSPSNLVEWLPHQSDVARIRWRALQSELRETATTYSGFKARIIPRSFFALVAILSLFLIVGVIVPLFFLAPTDQDSRDVLLIAFIPLCLAFIAYVGYELGRLRAIGNISQQDGRSP